MTEKRTAKQFTDLDVWKDAHSFVLKVYKFSRNYPEDEKFGLTSQIRRAAVSVAANIVEGFKRKNRSDKIRMYNIAQASLEECRYFLILSKDLDYGDPEELDAEAKKLAGRLTAFIKSIQYFDKEK